MRPRAWIFMRMRSHGRRSAPRHMRTPRARRWRGCILHRKGSPRHDESLARWWPVSLSLPRRIPLRRWNVIWHARPALAANASVREHCEQALELLAPFHAELLPLLPALEPLWTHNDLHASNLFWSDAGDDAQATAIIDFGLADRTNAVHDLAHAIERNIVEWLVLVEDPAHPENVPVHLDHLHALLEGYESVRPLSDKEAAALAPMTALCHAEFALSEADYFLSVLQSEEKASDG